MQHSTDPQHHPPMQANRTFLRCFKLFLLVTMLLLIVLPPSLSARQLFTTGNNSVYLPLVSAAPNLTIRNAVTQSRWWNTYFESNLTVGEVVNDSQIPAYNVRVILRVYNRATGQLLQTYESAALLPTTRADQPNPFRLEWSNNPNQNPGVRTELSLIWDTTTDRPQQALTVVTKQVQQTAEAFQVTGEVRNDGTQPVSEFTVATTVYASEGYILDARGIQNTTPLPVGATSTYTITFNKVYSDFQGMTADNIRVQAQGRIAP